MDISLQSDTVVRTPGSRPRAGPKSKRL